MADIQIVYRVGSCDFKQKEYDIYCHTSSASDCPPCKHFLEDRRDGCIPFGDCARAYFAYNRKGWSGKFYEMEEIVDDYNQHLNCMLVKLGKQEYECVKVILDGKCIYDVFEEDENEQ